MSSKASVYIETSVVSYLVARPSRDVVLLGHQQITREWWAKRLGGYEAFISPIVVDEVRGGDKKMAQSRLLILREFPLLRITSRVERLAATYLRLRLVPEKALRDALHIAVASVHAMDYLITWNCSHIANGEVKRRLSLIHLKERIPLPAICTPEELMED